MDDDWFLEIYTSVADCCGLHAIVGLPQDFEKFKSSLLQERNEFPYHEGENFTPLYDKGMRGAFILATTNHEQKTQEKYLSEFGFVPVGKEKNTNSGNFVTVWLISCKKLDRILDQWAEEEKK